MRIVAIIPLAFAFVVQPLWMYGSARVPALAERLAGQSLSLGAVARELKECQVPTARGRRWHAATVTRC